MVRTVTTVLVLVLLGAFTLLNWSALSAPMALSLGFADVQAPLGLVLLAIVAVLCIAFAVWAITLQAQALAETRRSARELQAQRELADTAEASRFVELREFFRTSLEQSTNTLAAHLGQIEDRIDRERRRAAALPPSDGGAVLPPR
jgi:hypothetical protein